MSYNLTPLTDEELDQNDLIEEGVYDFEVIKSDKQNSKSGNSMAKLQLNVWDKKGRSFIVFDYLVFSNMKFCIRKIKHFCDTTGIIEEYNNGNIRDEFQGLSGKVHIGIQEKLPKTVGGFYPEKNVVIDYIIKDNSTAKKENTDTLLNDDLPF
jgi:hypothetical protein